MAYARAKNGFERLGDPALYAKASFIYAQVSSNTATFPSPVPTMPEFLAECEEFNSAMSSAQTGNHVSQEQKELIRAALIAKMHRLSIYVEGEANGDPLVIMKGGFEVKKPRERVEMGDPQTPEAAYIGQPGELKMKVPAVKAARTYEWQYTTDPEMKNWTPAATTASSTVLKGLTPGLMHYIRVRVLGTRGQVKYSDVTTQMVF